MAIFRFHQQQESFHGDSFRACAFAESPGDQAWRLDITCIASSTSLCPKLRNVPTMAERSTSPSPEEREKKDKEAKAKEIAEQATLPYKWTQQIGDLDLTAPIPSNIKGKDLDVKITKNSLKAGIKGQEPIIDV